MPGTPESANLSVVAWSGLSGPAPPPLPADTWGKRIDDLLAIRNLEPDWDGQGAEVPAPATVDGAIKLALHLQAGAVRPADRVIAGASGTVFFEWHEPGGAYTELEVVAPDRAEVRAVPAGANEAQAFVLPV